MNVRAHAQRRARDRRRRPSLIDWALSGYGLRVRRVQRGKAIIWRRLP